MDSVETSYQQETNHNIPKTPMKICYHEIYTNGIHPDARFPRDRYVKLSNNNKKSHKRSELFEFCRTGRGLKNPTYWLHMMQNMWMIFFQKSH